MTDAELKAATLTEEDTKEISGYFSEGVHSVTITSAKFEKNANGKVFLNVEVSDGDREGAARLWFTGKATPYSINTIRTIFVHNADSEDDKEKPRSFFKNLKSLYDLSQVVEKLNGKQCWYSVQKTDETYEADDGSQKHHYDKNVWGYEPTLKSRKDDDSTQDNLPDHDEVESEIDLSEIPF